MPVRQNPKSLTLPCTLCAANLLVVAVCAQGQTAPQPYPNRPVRLMVPFPPGGANDIVARLTAQKLSARWNQSVIIDNRAGAGGNIGTETGARANADGYTLTIGSTSTYITNVVLEPKLPFDPRRDFAPISLIVTAPNILVVYPPVAATTLGEFIKLARASAKRLNFSSFGDGSSAHLVGEMFKRAAGVDMVHVPYRGGGPALAAVMGGEVQTTFANLSVALPQVKGSKVRGIAVTSIQRATLLPDTPTVAESGLAGFEAIASVGLLAPAGTPRSLIAQVNADVHAVIGEPQTREQMITRALEIAIGTPEDFARYMHAEIERWGKVAREAGISLK
jgi:tripartite-type tricarboxylate transporter receptor subunit TctC